LLAKAELYINYKKFE